MVSGSTGTAPCTCSVLLFEASCVWCLELRVPNKKTPNTLFCSRNGQEEVPNTKHGVFGFLCVIRVQGAKPGHVKRSTCLLHTNV